MSKYIGTYWNTNNYGVITIIKKHTNSSKYVCQFEDGTIVEARIKEIKSGEIKNNNKPVVCGVAKVGYGKFSSKEYKKEYTLWCNMIKRCYYEPYLEKCPSYRKCKVCDNWLNFQNFCEDLPHIEGYEKWYNCKEKRNKYHLDKDFKQKDVTNKIYSKDTCMFIDAKENTKESHERNIESWLTGLTYIGTIISDNYTEEFVNIKEFARKYKVQQVSIRKCIRKIAKIANGWIFKTKEKECV